MASRFAVVVLVLLALTACTIENERDHHALGEEPVMDLSQALSDTDPVSTAVDQSCTTAVVKGLSTQLVDEIQCLRPGTFDRIDNVPGLTLGNAVFPYLQAPAQRALLAAQKARGATMSINSALRTLPQQYLLYRWYQTGRCGIGLAAAPGKSNHESALAVDINDNAGWQATMKANSFEWLGASDPVHFDFVGEGRADIRGLSVLAFQRLWNRNHPEDLIGEDSDYGPATAERLAKAPVGGFAKGADCPGQPPSPPPPSGSSGNVNPPAPSATPAEGEDGCGVAPVNAHVPLSALAMFALLIAMRRLTPSGIAKRVSSSRVRRS